MGNIKSRKCMMPARPSKNGRYKTLSDLLGANSSDRVLKDLKKQMHPNKRNHMGMTLLHLAAEMGSTDFVRFLIAIGADVNMKTGHEHGACPPLVFAAANGHAGCARLMLQAGAHVNEPDQWGNTALFKAACYNHLECVQVLMDAGADPHLANRWGALPLQYAARQGNTEIVRVLLQYGCDPNTPGERNEPCTLAGAAMMGYHRCVKLLIAADANVNYSPNDNGETALFYAMKHYFYRSNDPLCESATPCERLQCMKALIQHGAMLTRACVCALCSGAASLWSLEYVMFATLSLQALTYIPGDYHSLLSGLFAEFARLGPYHFDLITLLCSTGFTPKTGDHNQLLGFVFPCDQLLQLQHFSSNPRSLKDLCRLQIRSTLPGNVTFSAPKLPLPKQLIDYIIIQYPIHHSL